MRILLMFVEVIEVKKRYKDMNRKHIILEHAFLLMRKFFLLGPNATDSKQIGSSVFQ